MTIGAFVTITNPIRRQDKYLECISCLRDLCDDVVVVDGGSTDGSLEKIKGYRIVHENWPHEWNWVELPRHLNMGLDALDTDWILKFDVDQFISKTEFSNLKEELKLCPEDINVVEIQQMNTIYGKRFHLKTGKRIILRGSAKDKIQFGEMIGKYTDLCQLVEVNGHKIVDGYKLPIGHKPNKHRTGIRFWNYPYFFKTKEPALEELMRFSRAHYRYFGKHTWGTTKEQALKTFLEYMAERYKIASKYSYMFRDHPEYIRKEVENLKPEQFGYSGWGLLK